MKKVVVLSLMFVLAALCFAAGEEVLQPLMKSNAAVNGKMRKAAAAKAHADVANDAKELQGNFKQIGEFFEKRGGMADAVKIARDAENASKDLAAAAAAGNEQGIADGVKAVGGACGACHMAHRNTNADGTYSIK